MPELPEVETVARGLSSLEGLRLDSLELFDKRVWFESEDRPESLSGLRLNQISRRGKYLLFRFDGGVTLVQHLRMTGKMLEAASPAIPAHIRALVGTGSGRGLQIRCRFRFKEKQILFYDTRRFGTITLVKDEGLFFDRKKIAPDPFHDNPNAREWFLSRLGSYKKTIKAALLDQSLVAGVGNIYADEALFRVGLDPRTPASRIEDAEQLWNEILFMLKKSIELGGSTIRDYVSTEGTRGLFATEHFVYGRESLPCRKCGHKIRRITLVGRSTHYCPSCQIRYSGKNRPTQGASRAGHSPSKGISAKPVSLFRSKRRSPK